MFQPCIPVLIASSTQLAQQTMPHVSDAKGSKTPFQLSKVLNIANEVATSTVWKNRKDVPTCWGALSDAISQVIAEANALLPITMDPGNVVKCASLTIVEYCVLLTFELGFHASDRYSPMGSQS